MTENELDHIAQSINRIADSIETVPEVNTAKKEKIASIIKAAKNLSDRLNIKKTIIRSDDERMEEIQNVLNAYLLRDFSKVVHLSNEKDNIDAFGLSINYFGQDLKESFEKIKEHQQVLEKKNEEILILLKEVNHRVKNNFQIINSLLSIQIRSLKDATLAPYFNNIKNRIYSMAQAHEMLHRTKDFSNVDYQQYIIDISNNIVHSFNDIETHISLKVKIDEGLSVNMDTLTTIGLLINEIVTNSVKHAFTNKKNGKIEITLSRVSNENCQLMISDDGIGTSLKSKNSPDSIGLTIVDALVEQLEGKCICESSPKGTLYNITFNNFID